MPIQENPLVPETGRTGRAARLLLVLGFLAALLLPGALQLSLDRSLQEFSLFSASKLRCKPTLLRHIQDYEAELEDRSVVATSVQPPVQWLQLTAARQGNEKVVVGRDGWLFYRPDLDSLTGRSPKVDPLPAIVKFRDALKARDIDLVLAPVPVKATIYPERLAGRYDPALGPPVNRSLQPFFDRLRESGVAVVDLTPALWEARYREELFLPLDSHWTPSGMGVFAAALGAELKRRFPWLESPTADLEKKPLAVTHHGDILDMLRLPVAARPFPATRVTIEQVIDKGTGRPVENDEKSPVVLLGDSATNIYSAEAMKWGAHAGLGEHLALHLARPVHTIAVNGGAATEARRRLAAHGLSGKALVVWQFILRDFTSAAWEEVPLPAEAPPVDLPPRLAVKARIVKLSEPPVPDAAEIYPDTLTHTLYEILEVREGVPVGRELQVVEWVQLKKKAVRAADYQVGDVHELVLEPLRQARRADKAIAIAASVDDIRRPDLPAFWRIR